MAGSSFTVTPDNLGETMEKILSEYGKDAYKMTEKAARKAARASRSLLKATKHVKSGAYARGWSTKYENKGTTHFEAVVYNRTKPGLPHLLNDSHPVGRYRKGFYKGDGEVDRAEEAGKAIFIAEVQKLL